MEKKIALVTGANRGIGFEVARQLAAAGFHVILAARDKTRGKEAARKIQADGMVLDVTSYESIANLAKEVKDKYGGLDVLVNNAGVMMGESKKITQATKDEIEQSVYTNALGPLFMTNALLDILNPHAQVIMVSSGFGEMCAGFNTNAPLYSATKTFLNAITRHLAQALQSKPVYINAVCPGWVRTDMGGKHADRSVKKGAETIVWLAKGEAGSTTGKFLRDQQEISW
jgi:NAD(P)-dependent dehydrogenase (short-subunit alcohol dehydrogenase family)